MKDRFQEVSFNGEVFKCEKGDAQDVVKAWNEKASTYFKPGMKFNTKDPETGIVCEQEVVSVDDSTNTVQLKGVVEPMVINFEINTPIDPLKKG